jgi:S-adenosylhomocysteine hydrolase
VSFLADKVKDAPLDSGRRYEFLCVQHLLDSQLPVFDALKKLGMSPARTTVVGVPYSSSDLVVQAMEDRGWDVRVPPLDMDVWVEDVRAALYERLESALEHKRDIAVMDDGGIVAKLVSTDPLLKEHAKIFKIVEQTRRGITVADEIDLAAPVVNVAQSWGKFVEGPFIGSDVEEKCVERLAKIGVKNLKGKHVGIVGAGTIGMPLALEMKRLGAIVTILDPSADAQAAAKKAGLKVAADRPSFFGAQDIIVGATGIQGITAEDISHLKDGCILGSASSKLVEIDVGELASLSEGEDGAAKMKIIDAKSHPPSVAYELNDGRTVKLLARGYPMNFDGAQENIPPEHIQLTRALMVLGLLQATGSKVAGVKRLDPQLQLDLLQRFQDSGIPGQSKETAEALELAMTKLREAIAKPGSAYRRRGG